MMSVQTEILIALISFCFVTTVTPGPNNMMLLSSGVTWGFKRTIPHIFGISGGCAIMVIVLGWTVAGIASQSPLFYRALHILSTAYLLWLAWKIATSTGPNDAQAKGRPLRLIDAAAFQWVNPKAWAMVLGAIASFARPGHLTTDVPLIAGVLVVVGLPCIALWAGAGTMLKGLLRDHRALRGFNIIMALLLVASILPGLRELVQA
jgi:threonine/homoserine/homoserine lactone efflux protein